MTSSSTTLSARMVFSSKTHVALAVAVATAFWVIFNYFDGLLLFSPTIDFYTPIPSGAIPGFVFSNITAPLVGIVVSMNVYIIRNFRSAKMGTSFFSGSILSTASSMCVGCSSIGVFLATTFGTAGAATSSFMANYQIPFRLLAIGLLAWAYYSAHRKITKSCTVKP
jgi:hypothetical protein